MRPRSGAASHYETVPLARLERIERRQHGQRQETRVLDFFRAFPDRHFSREEIEGRFTLPPQSASRVLANLTAEGAIYKTTITVRSRYNRLAHTWRLRPAVPEQAGLFR